MATNQDLIDYYANLLIIQYRGQPNAFATIQALIEIIMIYEVIESVKNGYSLDDAIGVQLDILGKYTGVNREVIGIDFTRTYFGYADYSESVPKPFIYGYADYSDMTPDVQFRTYEEEGGIILLLNDEEYRLFQRLKADQNYSNGSLSDIDSLLLDLFEGNASVTESDIMELTYIFPVEWARIVTIANSEGLIPQPMGVNVIINFV